MSLADKITSDIKSLLISGSQVRVLLRSPMKSIGYMGFSQRVEKGTIVTILAAAREANFSPPFPVDENTPRRVSREKFKTLRTSFDGSYGALLAAVPIVGSVERRSNPVNQQGR